MDLLFESIELGYTDSDVEKKIVNLVEGENFKPTFLRIVRVTNNLFCVH